MKINNFSDENKRERDFYRRRGLPYPKANSGLNNEKDVYTFQTNANPKEENVDCHRSDEQVNILLESMSGIKQMKRKFIRCSAQATITHLKKFVAKKLYNNLERYRDVSIICLLAQPLSLTHIIFRLKYCAMKRFWEKITRSSLFV